MPEKTHEEKTSHQKETQPRANRSDQENARSDGGETQQARRTKGRAALHQFLTIQTARDARQARIQDGTANDEDGKAEAEDILRETYSRSRTLLAATAR